jgi:hypothetical protein
LSDPGCIPKLNGRWSRASLNRPRSGPRLGRGCLVFCATASSRGCISSTEVPHRQR